MMPALSFMALLAVAAQNVGPLPASGATPAEPQTYDQCIARATGDPASGERFALDWRVHGGNYLARQCLGIAYANQGKFVPAAGEFEGAATEAEAAHDLGAARYWSQAGNAWLAAGQAPQARTALDAALAAGTLTGLDLGEAQFDRGRALVAIGELRAARTDIDHALKTAKDDPLVWLASAALARRMGDLGRARTDVGAAYDLANDDASVYLEIGNIAAAGGDAAGAQAAWSDAIRVAPNGDAARRAADALKQFQSPATGPSRP